MGGFLDMACAPQVVVEPNAVSPTHPSQIAHAFRAIAVSASMIPTRRPLVASRVGKISGDVGLTRSPSIRMNRNDLGHGLVFDALKGNAMHLMS